MQREGHNFLGLLYPIQGNVWIETCKAETEEEAFEELERNDSNLLLFTIEEARELRDNLSQILKEMEGKQRCKSQ